MTRKHICVFLFTQWFNQIQLQVKTWFVCQQYLASEKAMAPHSSTLAWKIPQTEEPGGLQSMGSHRVGHGWRDLAGAAAACLFIRWQFSAVQSLSCVWFFVTLWTAACQASLTITNSKLTQTPVHWVSDAIQPPHPLSSPSPPALSLSQDQDLFQWVDFFASGGQSIGASASASVLSMNIQGWFPLGWTSLILGVWPHYHGYLGH